MADEEHLDAAARRNADMQEHYNGPTLPPPTRAQVVAVMAREPSTLVKSLRENATHLDAEAVSGKGHHWASARCLQAADVIEQLVRERDEARRAASPSLTSRQAEAFPLLVADLQSHADTSTIPLALDAWTVEYAPEVRPGRGHDVRMMWHGGEHLAGVTMDPYGYGQSWVSETTLVHQNNEFCTCERCVAERYEDES